MCAPMQAAHKRKIAEDANAKKQVRRERNQSIFAVKPSAGAPLQPAAPLQPMAPPPLAMFPPPPMQARSHSETECCQTWHLCRQVEFWVRRSVARKPVGKDGYGDKAALEISFGLHSATQSAGRTKPALAERHLKVGPWYST